nr:transposase [Herpetosiphonaceae bacterium]
HRVLNRAVWSSRTLSAVLLHSLVRAFVAADLPIVVGLDETIERRRGVKIAARGIYRDPVRSSATHFVKTGGLRWVSMQLLTPIPWIGRVWALPFLTVLAPSERYAAQRGRRHKTIPAWGRQMILQLRRWLPNRRIVVVADGSYAVLDLLARCTRLPQPVTMVTRLRLDAALYDAAPSRSQQTIGRPRCKGKRQPPLRARLAAPTTSWEMVTVQWYGARARPIEVATNTALWYHAGMLPVAIRWVLIRDPDEKFTPQAVLCTDLSCTTRQIVEWFVMRWQLEVTFHEVRSHLGVETQRQWAELAILRTTPALLGLFSLVVLFAHQLLQGAALPVRQAAWYTKAAPTFADTLAFVRRQLWPVTLSYLSPAKPDVVEIPRALLTRLTDTLAFAA